MMSNIYTIKFLSIMRKKIWFDYLIDLDAKELY